MSFFEYCGQIVIYILILILVAKIFKGIWSCWLGYKLGFGAKWNPAPSNWAVITGSTDGIGLEYAKQLAGKGYPLLLISRNPEKLENTKLSIQDAYPRCQNVSTLAVDFGSRNVYSKIEKALKDLESIDVLVNNVGVAYKYPEYFDLLPDSTELINNLVNINIMSVVEMTKLVLPRMASRHRGVIINVSSMSASHPVPLLASYSATKAFVDYFSRSLHQEYEDKGIIIQAVLPSFVKTNMSKIRKTSFLVPSADDFVKSAIKTVGIENRTYGYWTHKLQGFVADCIYGTLFCSSYISKLAFKELEVYRKKYYRKFGLHDPLYEAAQ